MDASTNSEPVAKRRKVPKAIRQPQIIALQASGMTQTEIADQLGVSRQSITRDLREIAPAKAATLDILARAQVTLESLWPVEKRMEKVVALGEGAKNEAIQLESVRYANDLAGIVTQKELVRTRRDEPSQPQAMFMLPPGAMVSVSIGAAPTATYGKEASGNDLPSNTVNVTPTKQTE